jgi:hypothetical protein
MNLKLGQLILILFESGDWTLTCLELAFAINITTEECENLKAREYDADHRVNGNPRSGGKCS